MTPIGVMKWDQLDFTQCNLVRPFLLQQLPDVPVKPVGILLHYTPEAPKLKSTWVKKGPFENEFLDLFQPE